MKLFKKVMNTLGRYRLIPDRHTGEEYMDRYYLFLKDRKHFPFNVTLHKIKKSDDPIFHDHPWPYLTIVLKGGYWEHTPVFDNQGKKFSEVVRWRGPGSIICRSANEYHWLELDNEKPATTLFFMGPQQRDWGFLIDRGSRRKPQWIQHEHYLNNYADYHNRMIVPKSMASKKKD